MNKKLSSLKARLGGNRAIAFVCRNLGLKILSLFLAILLWNYVISTNSSITRTRLVTGITGYLAGQGSMSSNYSLALLDDPSAALSNISVRVEVAQADFYKVSKDNIQVSLDLSSVRTAGTQQVPLRAVSSYGRVLSITPSSVSLTVEPTDARSIPVNVELNGEGEADRWYAVTRSNPTVLTVRGAASVVQNISSAQVSVDIEGEKNSFTVAEPYVLVASDGTEVPQTLLDRSSTTVSVTTSVYPTREIAIASDLSSVITGTPADGCYVESVTLQPDKLTVAAEQELLDSLTELHIEPISVDGASQTFSARAAVSALSSFKSISADEVYVTVNIAEEQISMWLEDVPISYINLGEGLTIDDPQETVRVLVTGPRSEVQAMTADDVMATVDLGGYAEGEFVIMPDFGEWAGSGMTFTTERTGISVELVENASEGKEKEAEGGA